MQQPMCGRLLLVLLLGSAPLILTAACLRLTDTVHLTSVPAGQYVIGWGPKSVGNPSCSAGLDATVNTRGTHFGPTLYIEKFEGGAWRKVNKSFGPVISTPPGQGIGMFRLLIDNDRSSEQIMVDGEVAYQVP